MTAAEYAAALKKGLSGGFLFYGEESYLLGRYLEQTRRAHFDDPDLAVFNHIRLEGEQLTPDALIGAMESLPVFAERKLIEISQVNWNDMTEAQRKTYLDIFSRLPEYEYNTLLLITTPAELDPGTPKKPSARLSELGEVVTPVLFDRQTPAKLNKWLGQHFAAWQVYASPAVCSFLIQFSGTDMYALSAQAEKCACYVLAAGRSEVTEQDVRTVASSITEYDSFALGDAILEGAPDRALAILADRFRRRERPELILSGIASVFQILLRIRILSDSGMPPKEIAAKTGIHAYRVELYMRSMGRRTEQSLTRALTLCLETDRKMKTTSIDPQVLLERLVLSCGGR